MRQLGVKTDNVSTVFLFPCLSIRQELVRQFSEFGFVTTYLYWDKHEYPFNVMFLLFQPSEFTLGFHNFVQAMEKSINFVETIDVANKVVLVYKVPAKFVTDYLLFLNGAYSLTSPDFKACFKLKDYKMDASGKFIRTSTGSYETEYTAYWHIFNKTEYWRNQLLERLGEDTRIPEGSELYEKCDINKETLTL